jgi:hypothetical protein
LENGTFDAGMARKLSRVALQAKAGFSACLTFDFHRLRCNVMDQQRENGALLIAASIVAAIRLRGEPIVRSPKVMATISDSVQLARLVLQELQRNR